MSYLPALYLIFFPVAFCQWWVHPPLYTKNTFIPNMLVKSTPFLCSWKLRFAYFECLNRVAKSWKWPKRLSTHTCTILSKVTGRNWRLGVSGIPRRRWRADNVKHMIYFILFRTGIRLWKNQFLLLLKVGNSSSIFFILAYITIKFCVYVQEGFCFSSELWYISTYVTESPFS